MPADCDDSNDCTDDICDPSGICLHPPSTAAGCCTVDVECDDNDSCTIDKCNNNTCAFINICCYSDDECDDLDDVCTVDHCVAGSCAYTPTGAEGCCLVPLLADDFSTDKGWIYGQEWERGPAMASSGGTGFPDPSTDHTTSEDDYIAGVNIGGSGSTILHDFYWLTSPSINASGAQNLRLIYWRWLNSDYTPYMQNRVQVFNGSTWVNVWQSGSSPGVQDNQWVYQNFDITTHANAALQVRFGFNIGSGGVYTIGQWNVDDVIVAAVGDMLTPMCCDQTSDCQGLYPNGTTCSAGTCSAP